MFLNFNGEVRREDEALLRADNRGFRYGDGLFETMLFRGGRLLLAAYHLERLELGMRALRLELPEAFSLDSLGEFVNQLCAANELRGDCRARLTVFRRGEGMYNNLEREAGFCLQVSGITDGGWKDGGLVVGVYDAGRKVRDLFSGIKSNNYLLSSLAGMEAGERGWDDCLLLNEEGRVVEGAAANVWLVRGGRVFTPPVSEGCVAGVMRRYLLEKLAAAGYDVREASVEVGDLRGAEEVFLSNAIRGIQWVRGIGSSTYRCGMSRELYREFIEKL
jgi:branched-chain amino acid aminotransferase